MVFLNFSDISEKRVVFFLNNDENNSSDNLYQHPDKKKHIVWLLTIDFSKIWIVQGVRMRLKQLHILSSISYVSYELGYTVQMRHIFSMSKVHHQVLKKDGTTQRCFFLNEPLLSLGYRLKIFTACFRLQKPIN